MEVAEDREGREGEVIDMEVVGEEGGSGDLGVVVRERMWERRASMAKGESSVA